MKIRDIQEYLRGRCPNRNIELLGTDDEPFLETAYAQEARVDTTIRDVASFASNSEEQLFYEFVQNAFDAHADSLCFYFDEKYLIVLNNGEPFYTDPRSKNPRDGQLYNFLVKNKSLKAGDKSKSGEFGQGSKLLYTLIPDKSLASNQTQLIKSIKGEKKGPYIISWKNREQLDAFRFLPAEWEFQDPHSGENDLLITKILMTYYPVSPGVDESLFSDKEFEDIRSAFERLVDPKRNINRLSRGTAMIVPLGKGQYESISAKENLERVKVRLGGFASITSEKERNFGRHLDHIFVGQEEVELHSVRSVFVDFEVDGQEFSYQFAFNPVFARDNYVNIFKTLPVLQAKYKFGFIIDSQNFDLDSSRQRINDTWKTSQQLGYAFPELLKKIKRIQKEDKDLFDYIYLSLIKSAPYKDNADCKFICEPFYKTFTPFLQDNVKTSDGEYVPLDKVRKPLDGKAAFPLKELGITSLHWINEDLKKGELKRYGLDAEVYSLKEAIADADRESLKRWILSIGKDEYLNVHDELLDIVKEDEELQTLPLFRSNKCCAYSFKDVLSYNNTVFFFSEHEGHAHLDRCPDLEYILGPISYASQDRASNNGTINVMKVSNNIGYFRSSDSRTDAACHILVASMDYIRAKEAIRTKIPLLKDFEDTYRPFCELFRESPAGTTVYDTFKAVGYVPDVLPSELFISGTEEIWDWTVNHQDDIYSLKDWDTQHMSYIRDLKKTYKAAGEPSALLRLYLDEVGIPQPEKSFSLHNSGKLSSEEYDIVSMFAETKGYHIVPQRFSEILKESPFETEEVMMSDIIENGATVDTRLLHVIVKVYRDILYRFRIQSGDNGNFTVSRIASGRNYTCKVMCEESKRPLEEKGFYLIEDSVKRFFSQEFLDQFELTTQYNLMESALSAIDPEKVFTLLPIVRLHNDAINRQFFNRIHALDIDKKIDTDDSRWEVITYALEKTDPYYRSKLLDIIRHNGTKLPSTIKSNKVSYNETTYDLYLLLGEVKEANELVESFLGCLPDGEYFRKRFYADNEETNSAEDVFNQLFDSCYLNVYQLEFCLDYAIGENSSYDNLEIAEDVSLSEAFEMISRRRFNGFDRYFSIPEYERDVQVLADHKLLLDDEILPKDLESWLLKDTQNRFLMSGLMSSEESHIQIRKALSDDFFAMPGDFVRDSGKLARTTDWIIAQDYEMTYLSYRYDTLSALVSAQPSGTSSLAVIRAMGKSTKSESGEQHQVFTFCRMESYGAFMDHFNLFNHERTLTKYPQALQFFRDHLVYEYRDIEFLNSHDLMGMPRFTLNTTAEKKNYQEFLNELYAKWKMTPESEKVSIFTSDSPVSTMLTIVEGKDKKSVFELPTRNNLYGFDAEKKMVIIQHPNKENMSEMKTLAQAAKDIEFFKNPFIALQSLYVEMVESGMDPKDILGTASKKAEELVQKLGDNAVEQLAEKADVVKDLVENLTKEELQMVADNKDKLQNLLEDMSTDDEDTPESKVRKMIGYIGEQVYKLYLEKNGINFEYSAEKGIGEYDFRIPGSPDTYLDVKTNLYTFVDAARTCFDLVDGRGRTLARDKHLLSLRDMNRSAYLNDLLKAGVTSFKVEGRLKDENYVKNITAYYRQLLDKALLGRTDMEKLGSGQTTFFFEPNPKKTFNRGFTPYFMEGKREKMASFETPKAMGQWIGYLRKDRQGRLLYDGKETIVNGDGLCFVNEEGELEGFFVNGVQGNQLKAQKPLSDFRQVDLYRNVDKMFEKILSEKSSERKIQVDAIFEELEDGFALHLRDEDGCEAISTIQVEKVAANKPEVAEAQLRTSLGKLGNTPFVLRNTEIKSGIYFLQASVVNKLKNEAAELLCEERVRYFWPKDTHLQYAPEPMVEEASYKRNITNEWHRAVYQDFGATSSEDGLDKSREFKGKEVMECKYCIRYEMGACSKQKGAQKLNLPLYIKNDKYRFRLEFDCKQCRMKIVY